MARIEDSKPKDKSGGYSRLFNNLELGAIFSRIHSTVISSGTELERIIRDKTKAIDNLDEFLKQEIMADGVVVAHKSKIKKCKTLDFAGAEPDFIIFKRKDGKQQCYIVELKDGHSFDTKKSAAEHQQMYAFIRKNAQHMQYVVSAHFCAFNKDNREDIVKGFKNKITIEEAMTGREFCHLLELDYDEIVEERKIHAEDNIVYFLSELIKIDAVKRWLKNNFR